jgi:intracellular sulfur oxidation DsrE/DsrF family protein
MKTHSLSSLPPRVPAAVLTLLFAMGPWAHSQGPGGGQGRGPGGGPHGGEGGFQEAIHKLFDNHEKVKRTVEITADGYKARTVSEDPEVAKTLQKHVREMRERLGAGLMIRRWDPAFAELVEHYKDIDHEFKEVEGGVEVVVKGKNPEAVKVAQNHAKIVSGFARIGPDQMHESHPRALGAGDKAAPAAAAPAKPVDCPECKEAAPLGVSGSPAKVIPLEVRGNLKIVYQVTDDLRQDGVNRGLFYAKKLLDTYTAQGIAADQVHLHLVYHGTGIAAVVNEAGLAKLGGADPNPNRELLADLIRRGVDVELCENTMQQKGVSPEQLMPGVKLVVGAFPRLVDLQLQGFAYIKFE